MIMLSTPVLDADSNAVKVNTLILSTDGNYSLNGGDDGRVELRDAWTLDLLHTFPKVRFVKFKKSNYLFQKCDTSINYLSLTHDQQTLVAAMKSGSVVAFKIDFTRWHLCKRGVFTGYSHNATKK